MIIWHTGYGILQDLSQNIKIQDVIELLDRYKACTHFDCPLLDNRWIAHSEIVQGIA